MRLIVLGLPLGNAKDISVRALEVLKSAKVIICEDTRVFFRLWQKLKFLGLLENNYEGKLMVINDFNEKHQLGQVLDRIALDGEVVLVSDAGMPTISDPGYCLLKEAVIRDWSLTVVPGPTAATSALAISGLSADRVLFVGFLPQKGVKRSKLFEGIRRTGLGMTLVIYEAPVRVRKTLLEIDGVFEKMIGEVVIARELTKEHEEVVRGDIATLANREYKGEVVILVRLLPND